ncbi:MAG: hypothetical protein HY431_00660 [Candidatus Levybacteria bacterium]|nr:hypothetical protein [Candidatus Levybacteria bacterium]
MVKKSFRKIPRFILAKIQTFKKPEIEAVAVSSFLKSDITAGKAKKFGISYEDGKLRVEEQFAPKPSAGKFSRINKFGKTIVRKDLPMMSKTYSFEAPNYGDWSNGSHEVSWDKDVYQRDKIPPKNLLIHAELIADKDDEAVVGFRAGEPMSKSDKDFQDELFFRLNLLQENFGTCDAIEAREQLKERPVYKKLEWEVLPPGFWKDKSLVEKLKKRIGEEKAELFMERIKNIEALNPLERYEGQSYLGNRLYYVFVFKNSVLAECPLFGNAAYLLKGDKMASWQETFMQTKRTALSKGATRILHLGNWQKRLVNALS